MNFTVQRQLSVAIENQPGRLAALSKVLADQAINIKDICIVDNVEQGVIRLIPSDPVTSKTLLAGAGFYVIEADVLVLMLQDIPGQLERVSQALAETGVNIEYAYGTEDGRQNEIRLVLKVSNIAKASEALNELAAV